MTCPLQGLNASHPPSSLSSHGLLVIPNTTHSSIRLSPLSSVILPPVCVQFPTCLILTTPQEPAAPSAPRPVPHCLWRSSLDWLLLARVRVVWAARPCIITLFIALRSHLDPVHCSHTAHRLQSDTYGLLYEVAAIRTPGTSTYTTCDVDHTQRAYNSSRVLSILTPPPSAHLSFKVPDVWAQSPPRDLRCDLCAWLHYAFSCSLTR